MVRLAILDLDGTLYRGSEPVEHAAWAVRQLLEAGIAIRCLTNNSGAEAAQVAAKLQKMDMPILPEWIWGTGPAAVRRCAAAQAGTIYLIGESGLHREFAAGGWPGEGPVKERGEGPKAVVSGICRSADYALLDGALQLILGGALWIATNLDATYPLEGGRVQPGAGSLAAFLRECAGRGPDVVIGKPEPGMVLEICADAGIAPTEAVMVGDREDTDIEAGRRAGCHSWMVLTGVASQLPPGQAGSQDLRGLVEWALSQGSI